ncbi:MAG: DNA-3-methyladenine glycosylase I [Clostridia bacterium]|nr:DNA-3-methyladenine glycosylase I [Clostridia bacterium]
MRGQTKMDGKKRCKWCNLKNPRYVAYHDEEWGKPNFDEAYLYEMLILECFQAGLSWECVLNKREYFREAYDGFRIDKVISYEENKVRDLLGNPHIIRNQQKIMASIRNSRVFKTIVDEFGSFHDYLRTFTRDVTVYETDRTTNGLSDAISKDLKSRGMTFVGSVTIYSYLQAIGVIYAHDKDCYLYQNDTLPSDRIP